MPIAYPAGKEFELRVKDLGSLDQVDVFVNGALQSHITDQELHVFKIERPIAAMAIAVHFEGQDGGKSAIVDMTDPANPDMVASQTGLIHSYLLTAI
jgi:hypothetical protein